MIMDGINLDDDLNDRLNNIRKEHEKEQQKYKDEYNASHAGVLKSKMAAVVAPPLLLGMSVLNHKTPQTAGSLSSNPGDMLPLEPYLVIYRNQKYYPEEPQIGSIQGLPTNSYVKLSNCHGFTKVKDVHIEISCTQDERAEIESLLKQGVIL